MPVDYNAVGYEALTVAATAVALTGDADQKCFIGRLETAQVRYRGDGTDPTASEGELMEVGETIVLSRSEISKTKFIRTGGTSGILRGHFYDQPASVFLGGA